MPFLKEFKRMRIKSPTAPIPGVQEAPYLNWLYRWPFISPFLSISKNFLCLEQRVRAECAIDSVADLLVSSEPIEAKAWNVLSVSNDSALYSAIDENKQTNAMSIGANHYHERQALMGWDSAFLTIFQNLAEQRDRHCAAGNVELSERVLSGQEIDFTCGCISECRKWRLLSEILEHLFFCRITVYELEYIARTCGFILEELEEDLINNELIMRPVMAAVLLDDINELQQIEVAIKENDLDTVVSLLSSSFSLTHSDLCDIAKELLPIGRIPKHITQWFAFGTNDMIETCVNDIPVKPFVDNVERWENMKRDLKNVTEAMVGILPPEDVVNRFTSFLDSKNGRKKKSKPAVPAAAEGRRRQ